MYAVSFAMVPMGPKSWVPVVVPVNPKYLVIDRGEAAKRGVTIIGPVARLSKFSKNSDTAASVAVKFMKHKAASQAIRVAIVEGNEGVWSETQARLIRSTQAALR